MNRRRTNALLFIFLLIAFPASSQDTVTERKLNDFLLIPILETAFSRNLHWQPDWSVDIPPDGFYLLKENILPEIIELSNGEQNFIVRRDREGRLLEFPFFLSNGYAKVETSYSSAGAIEEMSVIYFDNAEDGMEMEGDNTQNEQRIWRITFPVDFFPYSEFSPGGSFPPLTISLGDDIFYVFIFESPLFLTETWYNSEGGLLAFCKAIVDHENGGWRVRYLQIHDFEDVRFVDYFFDSGGNTTEVQKEGKTFSAIYRNRRPVFWQLPGLRYELQWDTQSILTIVKVAVEAENFVTEYRYEYERDTAGDWTKRRETAYGSGFGVLAPYLPAGRGTWERRIVFFEEGSREQ